MQRIGDTTFGLDEYAWALLNILSKREPTFAILNDRAQMYEVCIQSGVQTNPAGNWATLTIYASLALKGARQVIAFGRNGLTDQINVEVSNIHTHPAEQSWKSTLRFAPLELARAADTIVSELAKGYRALRDIA